MQVLNDVRLARRDEVLWYQGVECGAEYAALMLRLIGTKRNYMNETKHTNLDIHSSCEPFILLYTTYNA